MIRRIVPVIAAVTVLAAAPVPAGAYPMRFDPAADYAHMDCAVLEHNYAEAPYFRMDRAAAFDWMRHTRGWGMLEEFERQESLAGLGVLYDNYERCGLPRKYPPLPPPTNPLQMILQAMGSSR